MDHLAAQGIPLLIPPDAGKRKTARPGWDGGRYTWMRYLLATENGHRLYRKRQGTVEPVFGQTVFNRKLTRFHRRGHAAVHSEWRLITATHNLLKLHSHRVATRRDLRKDHGRRQPPHGHCRRPPAADVDAAGGSTGSQPPFSDSHDDFQERRARRGAARPSLVKVVQSGGRSGDTPILEGAEALARIGGRVLTVGIAGSGGLLMSAELSVVCRRSRSPGRLVDDRAVSR